MGEDNQDLTERTVRIAHFDYTDDAKGRKVFARRGDTVQFSSRDIERGEKIKAFEPVSAGGESVQSVDVVPTEDTLEGLVAWIADERPSVKEVIERSKGSLSTAKLLVEAEKEASDGKPRKGVIEGLAQVIAAANE